MRPPSSNPSEVALNLPTETVKPLIGFPGELSVVWQCHPDTAMRRAAVLGLEVINLGGRKARAIRNTDLRDALGLPRGVAYGTFAEAS